MRLDEQLTRYSSRFPAFFLLSLIPHFELHCVDHGVSLDKLDLTSVIQTRPLLDESPVVFVSKGLS